VNFAKSGLKWILYLHDSLCLAIADLVARKNDRAPQRIRRGASAVAFFNVIGAVMLVFTVRPEIGRPSILSLVIVGSFGATYASWVEKRLVRFYESEERPAVLVRQRWRTLAIAYMLLVIASPFVLGLFRYCLEH
jgi:hypothetical protein